MLAGLVGGVIAAGAMSVVHKSLAGIGIGSPQQKPAPLIGIFTCCALDI
jgi:hypothetical protein